MPTSGWKRLLAGMPSFRGPGKYPIAAYSEFMPPPRLGPKPYPSAGPVPFAEDDPWGWQVTEYEEAFQLQPGLQTLACQLVGIVSRLGQGEKAPGIARKKLLDNPYWPPELANRAGTFAHERYVVLLPLALSRTQDDKGRLRWTLFGGSEQGPARAFWKSFFAAPGRELPEEQALGFFRKLLGTVYGEPDHKLADPRAAGFRILPLDLEPAFRCGSEKPLPGWVAPLQYRKGEPVRGVKYLLTFRPFGRLPPALQQAYLAGDLHLLPFPGSLAFWGAPPYLRLQDELPFALQIPLLQTITRHEDPRSIRVPQSGWLHEPRSGQPEPDGQHGPVRNTYKRTHRWLRMHRHEDALAVVASEDKLVHVLFSTAPDDIGLYGKPMARNVQLWTHDYRLLLDGPRATSPEIASAAEALCAGGLFGYRFLFPAMRVGRYELYWHRPLAAYLSPQTGKPALIPDAPPGYLTAYRSDGPDLANPIELWPRMLRREPYVAALELFDHAHDFQQLRTSLNVRKLLDARYLFGGLVPRSYARQLVTCPKHESLECWLDTLPRRSNDPKRGERLVEELRQVVEPAASAGGTTGPEALTYHRTARRSFEVEYWKTIRDLAHGAYITKDNADCILEPTTLYQVAHHHRDLEALGDYVLDYYEGVVSRARMTGKALVGELPFAWRTDFEFPWMGGWLSNQEGSTHERNLIVVIPGRDRRRAVIMADHYDTAYMEDHYEKQSGGNGARLAAAGADDNHSATAALMLGAPIFLQLSRAGRLGCDIWLIHLTGEEFPSDCLGARHVCQALVEGTITMRLRSGRERDLSRTRVQGVYVLDMVAHNNPHDRDVFQIAPGTGQESAWLAYQAHMANEIWNASVPAWNRHPSRRRCRRGRRSADGFTVPPTALHPQLHGEVRLPYDPRSTLYNTDGQIFSDAGVPVVLFMENYDINRAGYHDTHDTLENIDLDYGAGVAAIAIEAVARAATEDPCSV
jgi:hypothetical protein